jgi:predicted ATPase/class 3 adenylate cyclase/DNA-binding CsgD family transcriptional regulator
MPELPSGTLTFLFSDMEGSTALWERAPEAMASVMARHDAMLGGVIEAHAGIVVKDTGDGMFAVFRVPGDAAAAALGIQRAVAAEAWPTPQPIRVRIGVHTGEAEVRDGDYYGSAVNRCARLCALGHGQQTLVSEATAALVRDNLPPGATLIDLGEHRLRGLSRPERVFQLVESGLPTEFPSLASPVTPPHNLPASPTPLIGRQREVDALCALLGQDEVRLLTLTGPGGTGKTRLSLQAAAETVDQYPDGVFVVELAPISDWTLVVTTIARALDVEEVAGRPILDLLVARLRERRLLLVLDNFEQVLPAATAVDELLGRCPHLAVLVTSRAPLQLRSEHEFPVPPLALPDSDRLVTADDISEYGAVALFVERARAIRPDFVVTNANVFVIAEICARLDGLPLAIELAAARTRLLSPEALLSRLGRSLDLLAGGRRDLPVRQQTLRSAIAWSYDLLSEAEQRLFRRLSVFVGGFTLEAADAVANAAGDLAIDVLDGVESLVANSLVRIDQVVAGEPRFGLLETIREFGLEQLEASGETVTLREQHLNWCIALVEQGTPWAGTRDWPMWIARFEAEHDNIRAALRWNEASSGDPDLGLRLAGSLMGFWSPGGHQREARAWLSRLLARPSPRTSARASALEAEGYAALRQNDHAVAASSLAESLAIWRELDDRPRMVQTLRYLSILHSYQRDYDQAKATLDESMAVALQCDDARGVAMAIRYLADLAQERGEYAEAAAAYEQSLPLARQRGDVHEVAYALRGLGNVARAQGAYVRARQLLRESLGLFSSLNDRRCTPICLEGIACMMVGPGWAEHATRLLGAAQAFQQTTGAPAPPSEIADYQRTEADARAHLGEERFATVWASGAAMSLDEAVSYALADDEPSETTAALTSPPEVAPARQSLVGVPLSPREHEVVALIADGLSNREIADRLVLSVRTVERHIENVYNRLGIRGKAGRAIVTAYALRHGLVALA